MVQRIGFNFHVLLTFSKRFTPVRLVYYKRTQDGVGAMAKKQPDYLSYLLRLWRVSGEGSRRREGKAVWRASLESSRTGERRGFASLDDLFDFLREQTGVSSDVSRDKKERFVLPGRLDRIANKLARAVAAIKRRF